MSFSAFYAKLKSTTGAPVRLIIETFVKEMIKTHKFQQFDRTNQSSLIQDLMDKMEITY